MGTTARWSIAALAALILVSGMIGVSPVGAALQAPAIQAPGSGTTSEVNPELRWSAVAGAAGYRVQVSVASTFSPVS